MATRHADTRRRPGAPATAPTGPPAVSPPAPLGVTIALTLTLALACFAVVVASVELLVHPAGAFPTKQRAETGLYLASFLLILPIALIAVPRLADGIAATRNARALSSLSALLVGTLAAAILAARVLPGRGEPAVLVTIGIWWLGAAALLARATRPRPWDPLLRGADLAPLLWALAAALVLAALLAFTSLDSISPLAVALGLACVPGVLAIRARPTVARLPRRWGLAIDAAVVVLLLLAVPDLVIFKRTRVPGFFANQSSIAQFHQDFVLGPVNQVLHGGAVLVDTASQYGIGSLYFVAGWFQLLPIGYGSFGLLDGILFACFFAAGYGVLRLAGTRRLLAATALAVAVVVLIYNLVYPVGALPAQHGPLRFGLPMLVVLAAAMELRWPRAATAARAAQLGVVGLASVWALEAFTYTVLTFAGIVCFEAWRRRGPSRLAWLARRAALALGACVVAHLTFVAATLVFAGELPDYGWYLAFVNSFLFGEVGQITYDFTPWSPGLVVGVAYAASAAAFILVVRRRPEIVARERVAMTALAGTTAYGVALFSYFVDRSADHILPYVCLPALLAGTLWLSLVLRGALGGSRFARLGGLAFALLLCVLLTSVAWSAVGERLPQSALGHVVPGGRPLRAALHRLKHLPAIDARAPEGEYLLARYMPGKERVLSVVTPDLETEILVRSGHTNELPLGDPIEDSFVSSRYLPALRRAIARLQPGDRLLTQGLGLKTFAALRARPSRDPLAHSSSGLKLAPLQEWAFQRIGRRFDLKVIHRDDQGFAVATLVPRR
jgi:hypothetical protein